MSLTAHELFTRYFAPHYPPDALADLARARAADANPGKNPNLYAQIDEAAAIFARLAPDALGAPDLALDFSDASVHRLGVALTRARRDALLRSSGAGPVPLVQVVTHGALYVGACIVRSRDAEWLVRRPLWESLVRLRSRAGVGDLAPFHWWMKALSDDEIEHARLVDRWRTFVELPTKDLGALPPIAPPDRRIPRLPKVRYDTLYRHLRAHLPELRSVGDDFPSPERLDEIGFAWLEFALVGGGRMLLLHGPGRGGVHLFWLDASGFLQSAFFAADAFPAHRVEIDGERLRVIVSNEGAVRAHEMLWWGV